MQVTTGFAAAAILSHIGSLIFTLLFTVLLQTSSDTQGSEKMESRRSPHPVFEAVACVLYKLSNCANLNPRLSGQASSLAPKVQTQAYSNIINFSSAELLESATELLGAIPYAALHAFPANLRRDVERAYKLLTSLFDLPEELEPIIETLFEAGMIPKTKQNQAVTPAVSVMTKTLKPQQLEPREQLFLGVQSVLEFCSHMVQIKIPLA